MVSRLWGPIIVLFWLAAMSWLVWHDVWPVWTAQDPPAAVTPEWVGEGQRQQQAGIEDKYGGRIGTIWVVYHRSGKTVSRQDLIVIDRFCALAPAWIEVDSQFDTQGRVDELAADIVVAGVRVELKAERFGSQLAFNLKLGDRRPQAFKLTDVDAGMIGELFKPFSAMPDLKVGQSWRMQVFNPLAGIMGTGSRFIPMIVRVTGEDTISTPDGPVRCLIVEAPNARALVAPDGTVHVQEMELPIGGKVVIRSEPFDEAAYDRARASRPVRREFRGPRVPL